jgi:hypothetical protein
MPLIPRIIIEMFGELLLCVSTKRMCDKDSLIGFPFMVTPFLAQCSFGSCNLQKKGI